MQFCTELSAPWTRDLTTLERVQAAAVGGLDLLGNPIPGQMVNLPAPEEVSRQITAASAMIESHIRRPKMLLQTQYREYISGTGGPTIMLSVPPIASIDGITLNGVALDVDWTYDPESGIVFRIGGWPFSGNIFRAIEDSRLPSSAPANIVVDYTGGYVSIAQGEYDPQLPADMEQACILSVLQWAQTQTQNLSVQRVRIGDYTTTFTAGVSNAGGVRGLPNPAIDMLAPYVRFD